VDNEDSGAVGQVLRQLRREIVLIERLGSPPCWTTNEERYLATEH
jgi:hypothetical protein